MPTFFMMVGFPACGKSTFVKGFNILNDYVVISSDDDLIQQHADSIGKTYNDVFKDYYKTAQKILRNQVKEAVEHSRNIIWDQTNLTKKSRMDKLSMIPDNYDKYCVLIPVPTDEEWERRLDRKGKTIPKNVLEDMKKQFELPSEDEGFKNIWIPNNT